MNPGHVRIDLSKLHFIFIFSIQFLHREEMQGGALTARSFYKSFIEKWDLLINTENSLPWIYYRKREAVDFIRDSDYTPIIVTFLDWLGWRLGNIQLYERPVRGSGKQKRNWDRDCIWVNKNTGSEANPDITIEHENDAEEVMGERGEIKKILSDNSPIKVIITHYPAKDILKTQITQWRDGYLSRLRKEIEDFGNNAKPQNIEFLLILGNGIKERSSGNWQAWLLIRRNGTWDGDWIRLENESSTSIDK